MSRVTAALAIDLDNLRPSLLAIILRGCVVLGIVVCVPSVCFAIAYGLYSVAATDTTMLGVMIALHAYKRVPFRVRAAIFCMCWYVLGAGLLLQVGSLSQIYLFGFSVLTAILLGLRVGLAAVALSSLTLFAIGSLGHAAPEMGTVPWHYDLSAWAIITLNFTIVNALLTLAVGVVLGAMKRALAREIASRTALAGKHTLLRTLMNALPDIVFTKDSAGRFVQSNTATLALYGMDREEQLAGKTVFDINPPELAAARNATDLTVIAGNALTNEEERFHDAGGNPQWYLTTKVPLRDESGEVVGLIGLSRNITDRKLAEGQLRQAQKMEAVGQLAGGIAHDFNNLLSVILSYSDFVLDDLMVNDPLRGDVEEIRGAGMRAAELTKQLLTFSRQQVIEPKVLDLNAVLTGVDKMLRRLVGEDIEIATIPAAALGRVRADPGSIEQILVNLAVNARDAMPIGGMITMETANVMLDEEFARTHLGAKPGDYVMLAVTDTGTGMDRATLARIFEPFFTTKEQGKGTGLGLSTVFGIVAQSGGTIWVYSEPGIGTTFKVYLPRVNADVEVPLATPSVRNARKNWETILLVEDEDPVRDVAKGILERHGYQVLATRSAGEALLVAEQRVGPIHLLLTDVVMPQMSGPALAKRLGPLRPDMQVLFMSGYTDDAAVRHGVIVAEVAYLQKPLTVDTLTRKVRSVLDARGAVPARATGSS
jgi:two-component system cell cycle sensor histidine kinase/response regulator CckA